MKDRAFTEENQKPVTCHQQKL